MKSIIIALQFLKLLTIHKALCLVIIFSISLPACSTSIRPKKVENTDRVTKTTNATERKFLPYKAGQALRKMSLELRNKNKQGLNYLKKSGLNLILVLPSLEQLVNTFRAQHKRGEINDSMLQSFEKALESASYEEKTKIKFSVVAPGFEPQTTLPQPYGLKTQDGQMVYISNNFMKRFQVTTEYDLRRIIRNSSILISNFSGPKEQDNFKIHYERLRNILSIITKNNQNDSLNTSSILQFTASLMVIDTLLPHNSDALTAEEFYVASLIIGSKYNLFY